MTNVEFALCQIFKEFYHDEGLSTNQAIEATVTVAERCGLDGERVRHMLKRRYGRRSKRRLSTKVRRYRVADVDAFLASVV